MSRLSSYTTLSVDVGDLQPLFCRPRRSPKLNPDSRQTSLIGGLGSSSRRQSAIPRPHPDDSASQCENSSPIGRHSRLGKIEKNPIFMLDSIPKTILDNAEIQEEAGIRAANIKLALDDLFLETLPEFHKNTPVQSAIASSSPSDQPSHIIRESRSLEPFPFDMSDSPQWRWQEPKKSHRSLENCRRCSRYSKDSIEAINNNYSNGSPTLIRRGNEILMTEDVRTPLLTENIRYTAHNLMAVKRWHSLEQITTAPSDECLSNKKISPRNSIRSWLVNLFNGSGHRNSDCTQRRGIVSYDNQSERESIV